MFNLVPLTWLLGWRQGVKSFQMDTVRVSMSQELSRVVSAEVKEEYIHDT